MSTAAATFGGNAYAALARAESQGAAPGTEWPFAAKVTARTRSRRAPLLLAVACVLAMFGLASVGSAAWLHAKASLGQWLLARAWTETKRAGNAVKPWPWADLHPLARLTSPAHGVDVLVLEGANGRTLAWGPGHAESSALPGSRGNAVVSGHRDTHFRFLRALANGDAIVVEDAFGGTTVYRVREARIADHRALRLPSGEGSRVLTLVTCWPFDAIAPDTPWRYVVVAEAADAAGA